MPRKKNAKQAEKQPEKPRATIKSERFTRDLICILTEEEMRERADEAAHAEKTKEDLESEFEVSKRSYKNRIDETESRRKRLMTEYRDRKTTRPVECERRYLYETKEVEEFRKDTCEEIGRRPMTEQEQQREFDFGGGIDDEFEGEEDQGGEPEE